MKKAQSDDWSFRDEQSAAMDEELHEASEAFVSEDYLQQLKHVVDQDPAMKSAYLTWLKLSQLAHPTIDSARPYYEKMSREPGYDLYMEPLQPAASVESGMAHSVMFGLAGSSSIAELDGHFLDPLDRTAIRWAALAKGRDKGCRGRSPVANGLATGGFFASLPTMFGELRAILLRGTTALGRAATAAIAPLKSLKQRPPWDLEGAGVPEPARSL
ncbi:hypothetical protein [Arthrobacter sp. R-11]|uniref:hypothetical protein n=1 Tax=Arthrobacter sp. R-11 TaxID=3404053 RepID=UPI003CF8FDEF